MELFVIVSAAGYLALALAIWLTSVAMVWFER